MNALRVAKTETQSEDEKLFAGLGDLEKKAGCFPRVSGTLRPESTDGGLRVCPSSPRTV